MKAVWLVALLAAPLSVQAQQALQQAQEESRELTAEAVATQQRIDNLDDAARAALEEYTQAQDQALALNDYSERLQSMVEAQAQELSILQQQIDSLAAQLMDASERATRGLQFEDITTQTAGYIIDRMALMQAIARAMTQLEGEALAAELRRIGEQLTTYRASPVSQNSMASGEVELF